MIMASFGCYLPQTGHDHESTPGGVGGRAGDLAGDLRRDGSHPHLAASLRRRL